MKLFPSNCLWARDADEQHLLWSDELQLKTDWSINSHHINYLDSMECWLLLLPWNYWPRERWDLSFRDYTQFKRCFLKGKVRTTWCIQKARISKLYRFPNLPYLGEGWPTSAKRINCIFRKSLSMVSFMLMNDESSSLKQLTLRGNKKKKSGRECLGYTDPLWVGKI